MKTVCKYCKAHVATDIEKEYVCPYCGYEYKTPVVVTRHIGLLEWLAARGINGKVIPHVSSIEEIRGRVVYGVLPLALAAHAAIVYSVEMPKLRPEMRGKELSSKEMEEAGARLQGYTVRKELGEVV